MQLMLFLEFNPVFINKADRSTDKIACTLAMQTELSFPYSVPGWGGGGILTPVGP